MQSTISVREYELAQSSIELRQHYGSNLPVVLANRDEIQQVILNLVMNAQHAMMDAHGRGILTVRTSTVGDQAVVEIKDDGPGIAPDLAGRIFEPFFTTKSVGTGTGLGLALAFGIVTAHGGVLELTLPGAGFPGPAQVH